MRQSFPRQGPYLYCGYFPKARIHEVEVEKAPEFLRGLRAAFLTDVHLRPSVSDERLAALIAQLDSLQADLVLLGGDYAETPEDCARFFRAFRRIQPRLGCFAVPGNNDRENFASLKPLRRMCSEAGVRLLVNHAHALELPGGILEIAGCDEYKLGRPETARLFSGRKDAMRILLSHYPVRPDCKPDLMLSGHTHGGQFRLFGLTPYSIGFEPDHRPMAAYGFTQRCGFPLLISNGIGVSRLPLRIGAPAEIILLKF